MGWIIVIASCQSCGMNCWPRDWMFLDHYSYLVSKTRGEKLVLQPKNLWDLAKVDMPGLTAQEWLRAIFLIIVLGGNVQASLK